jgi:hypothetical protein
MNKVPLAPIQRRSCKKGSRDGDHEKCDGKRPEIIKKLHFSHETVTLERLFRLSNMLYDTYILCVRRCMGLVLALKTTN